MSRAARAYVADVERKAPIKRRAFTVHVNRQVAVQVDKKAQTVKDAASLSEIWASRPLKPPTLPANMPTVRSAGSRQVEKERPHKVPAIRWTGEGWRF